MNSGVLQCSSRWQRPRNNSLFPTLIRKAHTEWKPADKVFTRKALLEISVCQLSVCRPNSAATSATASKLGQCLRLQISAVKHTIVIHVFVHLFT